MAAIHWLMSYIHSLLIVYKQTRLQNNHSSLRFAVLQMNESKISKLEFSSHISVSLSVEYSVSLNEGMLAFGDYNSLLWGTVRHIAVCLGSPSSYPLNSIVPQCPVKIQKFTNFHFRVVGTIKRKCVGSITMLLKTCTGCLTNGSISPKIFLN